VTRILTLLAAAVMMAGPQTLARAQSSCTDPIPRIQDLRSGEAIDELTREKVDQLIEEGRELCEQGDADEAQLKFANAFELLENVASGGSGSQGTTPAN
jgi:hypothetical protein